MGLFSGLDAASSQSRGQSGAVSTVMIEHRQDRNWNWPQLAVENSEITMHQSNYNDTPYSLDLYACRPSASVLLPQTHKEGDSVRQNDSNRPRVRLRLNPPKPKNILRFTLSKASGHVRKEGK
jgi:hypothetical protein